MKHLVRLIALYEALKGVLALLAATGLLSLLHRDVYALALKLVEHAHLNPAANQLHDTRLVALALGAAAYAVLRCQIDLFAVLMVALWFIAEIFPLVPTLDVSLVWSNVKSL